MSCWDLGNTLHRLICGQWVVSWPKWRQVHEVHLGRPLFPGSSPKDQLQRIYKFLGTPDDKSWPKLLELPEYKAEEIPECQSVDFSQAFVKLDENGITLIQSMLAYNPEVRIVASKALERLLV